MTVAPQLTRAEIEPIAMRVLRLSVSRRDPEKFWLTKSELANELRKLARRVESGRAP